VTARRDGCRQTGRPTADYEDIDGIRETSQHKFCIVTTALGGTAEAVPFPFLLEHCSLDHCSGVA
jgi:hypothetical protein